MVDRLNTPGCARGPQGADWLFSVPVFEHFARTVDRVSDLQTMLTFKTLKCKNQLHYQTLIEDPDDQSKTPQSQETQLEICRFYHDKTDRRRVLLSKAALGRAQALSSQVEGSEAAQLATSVNKSSDLGGQSVDANQLSQYSAKGG